MGGSGKKPQNIFKLNRGDDPRAVLNWRLWFAVFSFGIMGAARGVDEGLISGELLQYNMYCSFLGTDCLALGTFNSKNFQNLLQLDELEELDLANIKGNVSAMVQIGSVGGAALYVKNDFTSSAFR